MDAATSDDRRDTAAERSFVRAASRSRRASASSRRSLSASMGATFGSSDAASSRAICCSRASKRSRAAATRGSVARFRAASWGLMSAFVTTTTMDASLPSTRDSRSRDSPRNSSRISFVSARVVSRTTRSVSHSAKRLRATFDRAAFASLRPGRSQSTQCRVRSDSKGPSSLKSRTAAQYEGTPGSALVYLSIWAISDFASAPDVVNGASARIAASTSPLGCAGRSFAHATLTP
mmetsp:Transcript_23923/g.82153  ORF Transcript_23923/g.82153 Transcript_23923/m.82153 type:complete len:234 (-) Transcript_23923:820-1521(-)